MPYITREDGERFIIPSYRDTLSAKKASLLKKEITLLSANYGEYIALQRKTANTYEVAFSPDPGYLLGECVWHYFKRPYDMIYCEEIPNSLEAILVIVKSGTVYLDGSFPLDAIPEELVIFKTQQNNFNIFIYGDVPISQEPQDGKFTFDENSVKAFTVLEAPVFPTLPVVKAFQLQLADIVLKAQGIGVVPVKQIGIIVFLLLLAYFAYNFITAHKEEIQIPQTFVSVVSNPYQGYIDQLTSPDPTRVIRQMYNLLGLLDTIPGWGPSSVDFISGFPAKAVAIVTSKGAKMQILLDWAYKNNAKVDIGSSAVTLTLIIPTAKRESPVTINSLQGVIATIIDRMSYVISGNSVSLSGVTDKKVYVQTSLNLAFSDVSPMVVDLIGQYIQNLPLVLNKFTINIDPDTGQLSGTITLEALGN
jgi:hypothetical protein